MAHEFLTYLRRERDRLTRELRQAESRDHHGVRLERVLAIVDDQMQRWTSDLADDQKTA